MDYRTINQQSLEKLLKNGAAKAVSVLTVSETHELTFEGFMTVENYADAIQAVDDEEKVSPNGLKG